MRYIIFYVVVLELLNGRFIESLKIFYHTEDRWDISFKYQLYPLYMSVNLQLIFLIAYAIVCLFLYQKYNL